MDIRNAGPPEAKMTNAENRMTAPLLDYLKHWVTVT